MIFLRNATPSDKQVSPTVDWCGESKSGTFIQGKFAKRIIPGIFSCPPLPLRGTFVISPKNLARVQI